VIEDPPDKTLEPGSYQVLSCANALVLIAIRELQKENQEVSIVNVRMKCPTLTGFQIWYSIEILLYFKIISIMVKR
jgi:hypothetical protein